MIVVIRKMRHSDVAGAVALQKLAFPPPFSEDLHWDPEHLHHHIEIFPAAQLVASSAGEIVGSCSNTILDEYHWEAHGNWSYTVGGPMLDSFKPEGTTLYGLDITVHPKFRLKGIGRGFYKARFELVHRLGLQRYGTACRIPDYVAWVQSGAIGNQRHYADLVASGQLTDRTLTPLLRYGLTLIDVIQDYMEDPESANAAALLEWRP